MTSSPSRLGTLALLPLLLGASCWGCGPSASDVITVAVDPGPFSQATLVPSVAHTGPFGSVAFELRIRNVHGESVDLQGVQEVRVEWSTVPAGVPVVSQGPTAVVTAPGTPGDVSVVAHATGDPSKPSLYQSLDLTGEAILKVSAFGPNTATSTDGIRLATDQEAWILVQGQDGSTPVVDRAEVSKGPLDLGANLEPRVSDGHSEGAAFARKRAVAAEGVGTGSPAWTAAVDQVDADPMTPLATTLRSIPVYLGIPPADTLTPAQARAHLDTARALLDSARVGIRVDDMGWFTHGLVTGGNTDVASPSGACETDKVDAALAASTPVQPSVEDGLPNLYVLFVSSIYTNLRGWACRPPDSWTGRVILISTANSSRGTLAHEIVHVLGLYSAAGVIEDSHVEDYPEFDAQNLMWSKVPLDDTRDHLTLGQLYRMNFDEASWLNADILPGGTAVRDCQPQLGSGVCPALAADPSAGSPP